MNADKLETLLFNLNACRAARDWCRGKTLAQAWATCERADWMLWLVAHRLPREVLVSVTCDAVECVALPYVPEGEERPRKALDTARAWCRGEATLDKVRTAAAAAYAAANDAADATYAADTATYAACANAAAYAAADAADAATYAAANDASADATYAADTTYREMCDVIRAIIGWRELVPADPEVKP